MPNLDQTGPAGQGSGTGRKAGKCAGNSDNGAEQNGKRLRNGTGEGKGAGVSKGNGNSGGGKGRGNGNKNG